MWKLALSLLVLIVTFTPAARATEIVDQAQCRLSFGNSVRQRSAFIGIRVGICQRERMLEEIPASIDCTHPSTWAGAGYSDGAEALARDLERFQAESALCSPGVTTTTEVGYLNCPAPCDALPTTTFPELGTCMECLAQATAQVALEPTLGTPPLPVSKTVRKCQEAIGRGIVRYLNKRMNLQHGCQFLKDIADPDFIAVDCGNVNQPTHPSFVRLQRARAKLLSQIERRCGAVMLTTQLDTCGNDAATETACVLAAVDQWTDSLLTALYPPF